MVLASVSKLNIHNGDPIFERVMSEISAAQEDGAQYFTLDANRLDDSIRMDLIIALQDLGYDAEYNDREDMIEVGARE